MRKVHTLVGILLFGLGTVQCGGDGNGKKDLPSEAQALVDAVFNPAKMLISGEKDQIPDIDFVVDEQAGTAEMTYQDYIDDKTGSKLSGTLYFTNTPEGDVTTLTMRGTIMTDDGDTIVFDITFKIPWDDQEEDFDGPPTSVGGSVTINGVEYSAKEYDMFDFENNNNPPITDPHFLVAAADGTVVFSKDGSEWGYPNVAVSDATGTTQSLNGIHCNDAGLCIAVGDNGVILRSTNGVDWSPADSGVTDKLHDVAYGNGEWMAVGENLWQMLYSDDGGANWSPNPVAMSQIPLAIAYGNGRWVVTGESGMIIVSDNLLEWTDKSFEIPAPLWDVDCDDSGKWAVVGTAVQPYISQDNGDTWTQGTVHGNTDYLTFRGLAYGQNAWVMVGWDGISQPGVTMPIAYTSIDSGATWNPTTLPVDFQALNHGLIGIATDGQGRWSAYGNFGDHLLSTDNASNWQMVAQDKYGGWGDVCYRP